MEDDLIGEAYVEHDGARTLIRAIEAMKPGQAFYDAKVKALGECIQHHVKEEKQPGGFFAQAKKGDEDLDAMGERLKARKEALMAEMGAPPAHEVGEARARMAAAYAVDPNLAGRRAYSSLERDRQPD